ncbi:MAG: TA system VapC family ribonuclease toxin [Pseudomarimonas sp.]
MRALLDINVLIALLDASHLHHQRARQWLGEDIAHGWASCPITQNGCVRILAQPNYPQPISIREAMDRLQRATMTPHHAFWADTVSLLDANNVDPRRVHGSKQITDIYLLSLAVRHGGRFVSFDAGVARSAVPAARSEHLLIL